MGFLVQKTFAEFVRVANLPEGERLQGQFVEAADRLARGGWHPDPGEWSDVSWALRTLGRTTGDLFAVAVKRRTELGITLPLADIESLCRSLDESKSRFAAVWG